MIVKGNKLTTGQSSPKNTVELPQTHHESPTPKMQSGGPPESHKSRVVRYFSRSPVRRSPTSTLTHFGELFEIYARRYTC